MADFVKFAHSLEQQYGFRVRSFGHAKVDFLAQSQGDTVMDIMAGIKLAFDPRNILNPGKVVRV